MSYSDKVMEHYEKPKNVGSLDSGDKPWLIYVKQQTIDNNHELRFYVQLKSTIS